MTRIPIYLLTMLALIGGGFSAHADIVSKRVEYKFEKTTLAGYFISDTEATGRRPTVIVTDEHGSFSTQAKERATNIAKLGYFVFIADVYGKDITSKQIESKDTAGLMEFAALNAPDKRVIRGRMLAGLELVKKQSGVNTKQIAAVGTGVAGTALIELARTGVDLEGVAVLHSPVTKALSTDKEPILPTFLILPIGNDPATPQSDLDAFAAEMKAAKIDCVVSKLTGKEGEFDDSSKRKANEAVKLYLAEELPVKAIAKSNANGKPAEVKAEALPKGVPDKVAKVLAYVDEHDEAMKGYEGGRTFGNYERRLPAAEKNGRKIKYQEWDVNPLRPGVNRGAERMITGSDDSAWYTSDHYETFIKIR